MDEKKLNKIIKYLSNDKWYHGTDIEKLKNIIKNGVLCDYNIGNELDFGYGFYLTNKKEVAADFIIKTNEYSSFLESDFSWIKSSKETTPVVIEFNFQPLEFYKKNIYNFKFLNSYDNEFAEFVFHNRLYNVNGESHHNYDMIFGVMSDSLPAVLLKKYKKGVLTKEQVLLELQKSTRVKQLSIHNQKICDILTINKIFNAINGEEMVDYGESK